MKWVHIGSVQAALFVGIAAMIDRKHSSRSCWVGQWHGLSCTDAIGMRKRRVGDYAWKRTKIDIGFGLVNIAGVVSAIIIAWLNYRRIGNVHKDVLNHVDRPGENNGDRNTSLP